MSDGPSITDDGVARLRARIGVAQPHPQPPHYRFPNEDAFRHVAEAYGDDNPLWCDPEYAAATRWGGPIAPPHLDGGDTLIGENEVEHLDRRGSRRCSRATRSAARTRSTRAASASGGRRCGRDTRSTRRNALVGVHDKQQRVRRARRARVDRRGVRRAVTRCSSAQYRLMIRTEREEGRGARQVRRDVDRARTPTRSSREIDESYASEPARRRGAEPRWWEDVEEGDEIGPIVKGPLRVTDMVCWHVGMGMGLYGVKALRLGYQQRQRVPRFFRPDDLNIPDVQQRVHWDPEWARRAGNPAIYDYGRMRETWLDPPLHRLDGRRRVALEARLPVPPVQLRRRHALDARAASCAKYLADGDRPAVELDAAGENQRGETTTPGHATILLPSREHGPVRLPEPPGGATTCQDALDALVDRFAAEERA